MNCICIQDYLTFSYEVFSYQMVQTEFINISCDTEIQNWFCIFTYWRWVIIRILLQFGDFKAFKDWKSKFLETKVDPQGTLDA